MQIGSLLTVCKKQNTLICMHNAHDYLCTIMALIDLIFVIFILYLLYKLVFGLILPVSKAAASVRSQMRNMQNPGMNQQNNPQTSPTEKKKNVATDSEYIDFEEIK